MKKQVWLILIAVTVICACPATSFAQGSSNAEIAQLKQQLAQLQARIEQLESKPVKQETIDSMVSKALEETGEMPAWIGNIMNFTGDLRYRYEELDDDGVAGQERRRNLVRARVALYGKVNDETDLVVRFEADTTLGDEFEADNANVDQMYFDYHPDTLERMPFLGVGVDFLEDISPWYEPGQFDGTHILGGKMPYIFYHPVNSAIFLDDPDLEGIAGTIKKPMGDNLDVFGSLGGFWVEENQNDADVSLWGIQTGLTYKLPQFDNVYMTLAAAYFEYGNIEDENLSDLSGNTADASGTDFKNDYDIINISGECDFPVINELPMKVFAEWYNNIAARSGGDNAYLYGISLGSITNPGDWQFVYNYRDVEQDAYVGVFAEGFNDGCDIEGHKFALSYKLAKNISLGANYFVGRYDVSNDAQDYDKTQVEVTFKF